MKLFLQFFFPVTLGVFSLLDAQYSDIERAERRLLEFAIKRGQAAQQYGGSIGNAKNYMKDGVTLSKSSNTFTEARLYLMNGNQIVGNIYDYGGIAPGIGLIRNLNNMVWRQLGDVYQFGPYVAAKVLDSSGNSIPILSDAINDVNARDISPIDNHVYGWNSIANGYVDPASKYMASNPAEDKDRDGKPDSWPSSWYNPSKGQYVWPGYLRQDVPNADLEVLWAMDDNANDEFKYFPIPSNPSKRGLGVKIEGRALQWSNSLAQNCIFFVYTAQNFSEKDLDTVYFGMYGDIDNGGGREDGSGGIENTDDLGYFISPLDSVHRITGVPVPIYSRSIVYFWDEDMKGLRNLPAHYDACKFLESPGNSNDLTDNDGDGMIDESQTNGLDDDKDWIVANDDVGIDGVPGTNDEGEGDGIPTAGKRFHDGTLDPLHPGEPHFELTDLDEADQIGLSAFRSFRIGDLEQRNDTAMWNQLERKFADMENIPPKADIAFIYGTGKISLKKKGEDGSIKRFSIALLMGWTLNDILITARTVQLIYNQNYQFIRPPNKPVVTAVPGDKKVTLYWDSGAEESVDPILGKDFEGYTVYRSLNPQFTDINSVTDGFGNPLLYAPLTDQFGKAARWDVAKRPEPFFEDDTSVTKNGRYDAGERFIDVNQNGVYDSTLVDDYWKGFSPVPYDQRGVAFYLGDNTGLQHSYVDSFNVINGQKYYYAVVSYDHGDFSFYSPSECTKRISIDPITSQLAFDVNTVSVTPGPRVSGYIPPRFASSNTIDHIKGVGTGTFSVQVVNDLEIKDNTTYTIFINDSLTKEGKKVAALNYTVLRSTPMSTLLTLRDTNNVKIGNTNLAHDDALAVSHSQTGQTYVEGVDYVIDAVQGLIRKKGSGAMASTHGPFKITYRYYPLLASTYFNNEEANTVFEGLKLFAKNSLLERDTVRSRFIIGGNTLTVKIGKPTIQADNERVAPLDIQIEFLKSNRDTAGNWLTPGDTLYNRTLQKRMLTPFKVKNISQDSADALIPLQIMVDEGQGQPSNNRWDFGEPLVVVTPPPYKLPNKSNTMASITITPKNDSNKTFDGDIYQMFTSKPFTKKDQFSFTTISAKYNSTLAASSLEKIKVVPNPYVAVNDIEPTDRLPGTTRGSRRIYFEHLPRQCTIRIYTLSGELVKELHHQTGLENGREYWDLLNRDNLVVAYGIYIAHIDAPGVGEKVLKFAIIH